MKAEAEKGYMSPQWTVWCGGCSRWDQAGGSKSSTAAEFKRSNWRFTRLHGWLCPECAAKLPNKDAVGISAGEDQR